MDRRVAFQRALFPTAPRNDRGPATLARVLRDLGRRRCTMGQPQMGGGAVKFWKDFNSESHWLFPDVPPRWGARPWIIRSACLPNGFGDADRNWFWERAWMGRTPLSAVFRIDAGRRSAGVYTQKSRGTGGLLFPLRRSLPFRL